MARTAKRCEYKNKKYYPCKGINRLLEDEGRGKGLHFLQLRDVITLKPSRQLVAIRSGENAKDGILINFCPICGADVSAQGKPDEKPAKKATKKAKAT